jgi:hypothetical protein
VRNVRNNKDAENEDEKICRTSTTCRSLHGILGGYRELLLAIESELVGILVRELVFTDGGGVGTSEVEIRKVLDV